MTIINILVSQLRRYMVQAAVLDEEFSNYLNAHFTDALFALDFFIVEAGVYDGSVDGVGMHIGEGWIGYGYSELVLSGVQYRTEGDVWMAQTFLK